MCGLLRNVGSFWYICILCSGLFLRCWWYFVSFCLLKLLFFIVESMVFAAVFLAVIVRFILWMVKLRFIYILAVLLVINMLLLINFGSMLMFVFGIMWVEYFISLLFVISGVMVGCCLKFFSICGIDFFVLCRWCKL